MVDVVAVEAADSEEAADPREVDVEDVVAGAA
jgi:hypothetical protein